MLIVCVIWQSIVKSTDCTKCHPERYWSHRAMGDRRGGMAAMICLTEDAL